jgi:hypothetical protein
MGLYFRIAPGVKLRLRLTKSGVRAGIGPRAARFWVGAGGTGVSTGAGPVSLYRGINTRSRRGPSRTSMVAYDRQVRAAQRAQEITAAGTALTAMLAAHQHEFQEASPPIVLPAWRLSDRKAAKERARLMAREEVERRGRELGAERAEQQRHLDEGWALLLANDPHTVIQTLDEAFEDNQAPATATARGIAQAS